MTSGACAFEKQWHLGGGVGAATGSEYALGPALNLYGAYGLSDVFDVRLEAFGSRNERLGDASYFYGAKAALAYKIDVIEWIPYVAVTAGVLGVAGPDPDPAEPASPFAALQPAFGVMLGLDYAVSRAFGLGLCVSGDIAPTPSETYFAGFLRAEHRFGW